MKTVDRRTMLKLLAAAVAAPVPKVIATPEQNVTLRAMTLEVPLTILETEGGEVIEVRARVSRAFWELVLEQVDNGVMKVDVIE